MNFDYDVLQCARNECQEEASVPLDLLAYLKSVGTLRLIDRFFDVGAGIWGDLVSMGISEIIWRLERRGNVIFIHESGV